MVGSSEQPSSRVAVGAGVAILLVALLWAFPLFRIVPLKAAASPIGTAAGAAFDPKVTAEKLWAGQLRSARQHAVDAAIVAAAVRADPAAARKAHARASGLGRAYYFVRGSGKVVSADRNYLRLELGPGSSSLVVALRIGPVFGNAVRDGCGVLDVNQFPGLQEFNALSAELNALVEKEVLPVLREKAGPGTTVSFVGCAEAPESTPAAGEPVLTIVPVMAEVR